MLRENKTLTSDCKMHKIAYDFITDPRWRLLDEHERENTFQNYMDELYQKEMQEQNQIKQENAHAFRNCLERDQIPHNARWD